MILGGIIMADKRKPITINKNKIREELEKKQILEIQKELVRDRRYRVWMMTFLLFALLFTISFGSIENPFQYTFSKIGNRFNITNRIVFIIWAISTGAIIQASVLALMKIEKYSNNRHIIFVTLGSFFLVASAVIPSLPEFPFWTWMHLFTAGFSALFLTMGFFPFAIWVARENPRLRKVIIAWTSVTWGGGAFWYITLGNTGMFEMWFFVCLIVFLLYLILVLFEEKIVKQSIILLRDEENLNIGIEKIFIDLEKSKNRTKSK